MLRTAATRTATRVVGRRNASTVAVQNLEARWKTLSTAEQNTIAKQLEEAQKGDWKALSTDEKKAACKFLFNF
jgi:cytochrome c oxidase subunit 4